MIIPEDASNVCDKINTISDKRSWQTMNSKELPYPDKEDLKKKKFPSKHYLNQYRNVKTFTFKIREKIKVFTVTSSINHCKGGPTELSKKEN